MYWPAKYFAGLSKTRKAKRKSEIKRFGSKSWKNRSAYKGFKTDRGVKTRKSSYSAKFAKEFPKAKSLKARADATGVPLRLIRSCYNRGMAAWRTGHRPGATQQQWGYARVSSFLTCGKTHYTTDADLVKKARDTAGGAKYFKRCRNKA
jgi:hypothetical protein